MATIYVAGEALVDMVPGETADGARCFVPHPGGSPFNAAKAASLAGASAAFVGALSTDFMGDMLRADLVSAGVDAGEATASDRPTALAFVDFENGEPRYAFHFEGTAETAVDPAIEAAPAPGDIVQVGGLTLADAAGRGAAIESFVGAQAGRRMISLDPNARPTLTPDREGWLARLERIAPSTAILKVSTEDLGYMAPGMDGADYAARALANGPSLVIVTGGGEGARAFTAAGSAGATAPRVEVVDTVGAGDTLMGSTLAWLVERGAATPDALAALGPDALGELLHFATVAAAINCTRAGCKPPTREEIVSFAP